jgi:lipopolysaccharide export system protein LptA
MASTDSKLGLLLAAVVCAGVALAQAPTKPPTVPLPQAKPGEQPIHLDAASSEVDYKTNTVVFKDVIISQGPMRVQADHARATGLNFANSKWAFDGNVRIDSEERGSLRSDSAVVEFQDNHIQRATVLGKPANFEQKRLGTEQMARGHADQIVYDVNAGTVRLTDDAWLCDGQSEISGPLLVYDIRAQRVQATTTPGTGQRVRITIEPNAAGGADKSPVKTTTCTSAAAQPASTPNS